MPMYAMRACFRPTSALRDLHAAVAIENTDPVVFVLRAVCMQVTERTTATATMHRAMSRLVGLAWGGCVRVLLVLITV